MNFAIFITALFVLQAICLVVGSKALKNLKNQDDYYLAGKGVGFFPLMMTLVATQIGGGLILGSSDEAYRYGWYVILYPLGQSLGFVLLALGIGKKLNAYGVSTIAQLFEVVYNSPRLKQIASSLSIISLFLIFVAQIVASKKFMISLGVEQNYIFFGFWAIVILYTVVGGLQAVVATDIIQAAFFMVIFVLCFAFAFASNPWTAEQAITSGFNGQSFEMSSEKLCGWLLMPLLFMVIEQDMGQRCFAAKSGKVVTTAAACAAIVTFTLAIIPVYLGVFGKASGIEVAKDASVFMTVVKEATNPVIAALVGCAVMAAIISTADSLINAISSNLTQDFKLSFFSKSQTVKSAQWITAAIAVLGIFCSFYFNNVVDLMIATYELSVCCLFVPVFAAIFKRKGNMSAAIGAIAFGAIGYVIFRFVSIPIPKEIASLALSFLGYCLGEALAWKNSRQPVEEPVLE